MITYELCFFSDVGCYHFIGTYARLTFRVRAHNFSLRGSLGGDRLPTQAYAREVLCNCYQYFTEYAYAATVSATFSYDCAPFYKAVHDPMIALKTMRGKRAI